MRRKISVVVLNEHGVLSRIVELFSARGYNIDSLTVAPLPNSEFSRINIITNCDQKIFEQITKQLYKLVPTYKIIENEECIEKEMILVKIPINENFAGLDAILKSYNGIVANASSEHIIVMACDDFERIESFLQVMNKYSPTQVIRGGSVMMEI